MAQEAIEYLVNSFLSGNANLEDVGLGTLFESCLTPKHSPCTITARPEGQGATGPEGLALGSSW